jgi:Na+/melibiose symporter-like transporter
LRASGVVTDPDELFVILLPLSSAGMACTVAGMVLLTAMTMDIVEQQQLRTGRRSEGLLFSVENLVKKITSGFGVFASGLLLTLAHFPTGAERGQVPESVMTTMAAFYIPAKILLIGAAAVALLFYSISRKDHEANLRALQSGAE